MSIFSYATELEELRIRVRLLEEKVGIINFDYSTNRDLENILSGADPKSEVAIAAKTELARRRRIPAPGRRAGTA